jgi:hypothetical protein
MTTIIPHLHAAVSAADIAASRAKLRHLPATMSHEMLGAIVTQLGLPMAAAASGDLDVSVLDAALAGTSLSVSDKIRLKSLLLKN